MNHYTTPERDRTQTDALRDVSHTPNGGDPVVDAVWRRGQRGDPVTDGGRRAADRDDDRVDAPEEKLKDVSHTPKDGDGANRVWDGTKVREEAASDDDE